jgi:hypothetical protein
MAKTDTSPTEQKPGEQKTRDRKDQLDETVWESFPNSDPGGSWAGKDIPPDERKKG